MTLAKSGHQAAWRVLASWSSSGFEALRRALVTVLGGALSGAALHGGAFPGVAGQRCRLMTPRGLEVFGPYVAIEGELSCSIRDTAEPAAAPAHTVVWEMGPDSQVLSAPTHISADLARPILEIHAYSGQLTLIKNIAMRDYVPRCLKLCEPIGDPVLIRK